MNRIYDEQLELQLQEYELAELDQLLPASPLIHAIPPEEGNPLGTLAGATLQKRC